MKKILLAEDDDGHACLMEINLRRAGFAHEIKRFVNGLDVLNYLHQKSEKEHEGMVILMDLNMPKMNGFDTLEEMKKTDMLKTVITIIVTSSDNPSDRKTCYERGCFYYHNKTRDFLELSNILHKIASHRTIIH